MNSSPNSRTWVSPSRALFLVQWQSERDTNSLVGLLTDYHPLGNVASFFVSAQAASLDVYPVKCRDACHTYLATPSRGMAVFAVKFEVDEGFILLAD